MGASNGFLRSIILRQSMLSGTVGYVIGAIVAISMAWFAQGSSAALSLPVWLVLLLAVVTLMMCLGASFISIKKVLHVDAASVFK